MNPKAETITLKVGDGTTMGAYVAHPAAAPRAAMLIFQEAFGVNPHIRDVAGRFAAEGLLAIAPELYHRTAPGFECGYNEFQLAQPQMKALTDAGLEADIHAAYDWVQAQSSGLKTAAIGYCMGGRVATLAALTVPLACGVSYYGGGIAPSPFFPGLTDRFASLGAPMLFFWGGRDQHILPEQVRQVEDAARAAAKPYVNVVFSEADHGFFCDQRASYHAPSAAEAWSLTLEFLKAHF
jgi:carboxymethylenebutenolidase